MVTFPPSPPRQQPGYLNSPLPPKTFFSQWLGGRVADRCSVQPPTDQPPKPLVAAASGLWLVACSLRLVFYSTNYQFFFFNCTRFFQNGSGFRYRVENCNKLKVSENGTFLKNQVKKDQCECCCEKTNAYEYCCEKTNANAVAAADMYFKFGWSSWYGVKFPSALWGLVPLLEIKLILIILRKKL